MELKAEIHPGRYFPLLVPSPSSWTNPNQTSCVCKELVESDRYGVERPSNGIQDRLEKVLCCPGKVPFINYFEN
jgi:hypothetical protein